MKKIVAIVVLVVTLVGFWTPPAQAGAAVSAALALGAFAVFNQLLFGVGLFGVPWAYAAPAYYPAYPYYPAYSYSAPVYAAPAPRYYTAPAVAYSPPPQQGEVVYPHGRYILRGDGVTVAYRWVWVPNPPPLPPPPAPTRY